MQERVTNQIASAIEKASGASGVLVYMEAIHTCMLSRGVRSEGCNTTTIVSKGCFSRDWERRRRMLETLRESSE